MSTKYKYKNNEYTKVEGKSLKKLTKMLKKVYKECEDEWEDFDDMVIEFANDDYYKYHYVAQEYKKLNSISD